MGQASTQLLLPSWAPPRTGMLRKTQEWQLVLRPGLDYKLDLRSGHRTQPSPVPLSQDDHAPPSLLLSHW